MNYFNYFSEIEELFIRRRGRNLLLSPLDWALIETWQERAVPLHIILSAIERVFDGAEKQASAAPNAARQPIKSLTYCRDEIETQYAAWLERQIGKNGDENSSVETQISSDKTPDSALFPDEMIAAHLERVSADLKSARDKASENLSAALGEILIQLTALGDDYTAAEQLEQSLEQLDALIDDALLSSDLADDAARAEIKRQLAAYRGKMDANVYERTFSLMLLKFLRERAEIPRLSLFNL